MAARKSAKSKSSSKDDPVIIEGQAEDVDVQENVNDHQNAAPNPKNTSAKPHGQKSPAVVMAGFALFLALLASGGVVWMMMVMTSPRDTSWQDNFTARLEALEQQTQQQSDQHSAEQAEWQSHLDQHGEMTAATATEIAALKQAQQVLMDDLTALKSDFEAQQSAVTPPEPNSTPATDPSAAIDPAVIATLKSEIAQLTARLDALESTINEMTKAASTASATASAPSASTGDAAQSTDSDQGGWWSSLFGVIKISRIPAEGEAQ